MAGLFGYLTRLLLPDDPAADPKTVRVRYGVTAGWLGIWITVALFALKMTLGVLSGSVSVVANAFHLLSHLANSVILVVTFKVTARPATAKNPFGHGRMEHIGPLVMSVFLFMSGIQIGEHAVHQVLHPQHVHYFPALPWILLVSILVKQLLARYITFLGRMVRSHAILANAHHLGIESVMSLTVIGGLVAGHHFHHPEMDGYIGVLVSAWLLYLGFTHAKEAVVPLLGKAPSPDILKRIRETARGVNGVEDVHEIIVHDYGSMYLISLHAEIPERFGPAEMHEITERCEASLRKTFGGEAVCHTDPLMEMSPELERVQDVVRDVVGRDADCLTFHDFRVVQDSTDRIIIVADIDTAAEIPEERYGEISARVEKGVMEKLPQVAYCGFYITPKFAY